MLWLQIFLYIIAVTVLLVTILTRTTSSDTLKDRIFNGKTLKVIFYVDDMHMKSDHGYLAFYREKSFPQIEFIPGNVDEPLIVDDQTVALVFNGARPPNLHQFVKKNIIGISHEPLAFAKLYKDNVKYISQNFGTYLISDASNYSRPFTSHYQFIPFIKFDPNKATSYEKYALISIMVSEKQILEGHKYRYALVQEILKQGLPIDIFGTGADTFKDKFPGDSRIKGKFERDELYAPYRFTIAVENNQELNYISEKYTNTIAYNTTAIYLGAPNFKDIFGEKSAILLTGDLESDMILLNKICADPDSYELNLEHAQNQSKVGGKANLTTYLANRYNIPLKLYEPEVSKLKSTFQMPINTIYNTVIITGANDAYFDALKTQIASIHSFDENNIVDQIIVLNLGLSQDYLNELETLERVTVLKFPKSERQFMEQTRPKSYAWKYPFIVYAAKYFEAKRVFWLDSGACFVKPVNIVFDTIDKVGCLFVEDLHINKDFTHKKCIEILQASDKELTAHQLCAGIAGYRTDSKYAQVFEETAKFSGIKDCVFDLPDKEVSYKEQNIKCHRHDQSILSILVARYNCPLQDIAVFGEFTEENIMSKDSKAVIYVHRGAYQNFNGLKLKTN